MGIIVISQKCSFKNFCLHLVSKKKTKNNNEKKKI